MPSELFDRLTAWLAPSIDTSARTEWSANGGLIATTAFVAHDGRDIDVFVGDTTVEDQLVQRLRALGVQVLDQAWIRDCIVQQKLLDMSPYEIDGRGQKGSSGVSASLGKNPAHSQTAPCLTPVRPPVPRQKRRRSDPSAPFAPFPSYASAHPQTAHLARRSLSPSPSIVSLQRSAASADASDLSDTEAEQQVAAYVLPQPASSANQAATKQSIRSDHQVDEPFYGPRAAVTAHQSTAASSPAESPSQSLPFELDPVPPELPLELPSALSARLEDAFLALTLYTHPCPRTSIPVVPVDVLLNALRTPPGSSSGEADTLVRLKDPRVSTLIRLGLKAMHVGENGYEARKTPN